MQICVFHSTYEKICFNEVQKAEYDENLNGYGDSIRWVTFVFWQHYVLVIPVQRAPADSHGKPCALVSVFGNLCGMHPLSVICLLYSAERDINSHVQAFPPKIWPPNISVHLLVHNKNWMFFYVEWFGYSSKEFSPGLLPIAWKLL